MAAVVEAAPSVTWDDLSASGIPVACWSLAESVEAATRFLESAPSGRICLKAVTQRHKTKLGLVESGLGSATAVQEAWCRLQQRCRDLELPTTMLAQEQIPPGPELIAGIRRDPVFGPIVLLGWGGTLAERIDRVGVRFCPVRRQDALAMTRELLGEADTSVAGIVLALSKLVERRPEIAELDLNPIILAEGGPVAVDLRVLEAGPAGTPVGTDLSAASARPGIERLLAPKRIAIIGASADPRKPGGRLVAHLLPYASRVSIYPVNPRTAEVQGLRSYRSVAETPETPDVAVIATDAAAVPDVIRECGRCGIKSVIVVSSGFTEAGRPDLEKNVRRAAAERGVRLCGVNTIGVFGDVPLTFSQAASRERVEGGVGLITQSGALGGSLLLSLWEAGVGTSRYVCAGNQTDLEIADYLEYLADDPATTSVLLFLEGVRDGRRLRQALLTLRSRLKPVVVLRAGATEAGQAAARSHTGALAGSDRLYRETLREAGALVVSDLTELVAAAQAIDWLGGARGARIGVVSTSGGACSLLADLAEEFGLVLPVPDSTLKSSLREVLPSFGSVRNPVDTTARVTADPGLIGRTARILLASQKIDSLLVAVTTILGDSADAIAADLASLAADQTKPLAVAWTLPEGLVPAPYARLRSARVPVFGSFRLAMTALAAIAGASVRPR